MRQGKKSLRKVITLNFDNNRLARDLFGAEDKRLRSISDKLGVTIDVRGANLRITGSKEAVVVCGQLLSRLYALLEKGYPISDADVEHAFRLLSRDLDADLEAIFSETIFLPTKRRMIVPRSPAQRAYIEVMRSSDVVFTIGPAGTGKSYLAVAMAVAMLLKREFKRIVLARPAVEAGEKLGFLPGDIREKINPYLRPLYDALYDMLEVDRVEELLSDGIIEIAPLAFMRGRTLHDSFVIIDEAQNSSYHQMKMCLTRLGLNSKMVITGDVTQIDLPPGERSGLLEAWRILKGCPGIAFHQFTEVDIVRHPVVTGIVNAYQHDEVKT